MQQSGGSNQERRIAMHVELDCTRCFCHFVSEDKSSKDNMGALWSDEPRHSLGDGYTFEDMIFATLMEGGTIRCPACGESVPVSEESLGQLAMEMLAGF
jgi:hypothetical protein